MCKIYSIDLILRSQIYMQGKIKEIRLSRHMTQRELGEIVGVAQQNFSRYEQDIAVIPIDILIKLSEFFNVTTDYLLGISDIKRNIEGQMRVNRTVDDYYEFLEVYKTLEEDDKELIWAMTEKIKNLRTKEKEKN